MKKLSVIKKVTVLRLLKIGNNSFLNIYLFLCKLVVFYTVYAILQGFRLNKIMFIRFCTQ